MLTKVSGKIVEIKRACFNAYAKAIELVNKASSLIRIALRNGRPTSSDELAVFINLLLSRPNEKTLIYSSPSPEDIGLPKSNIHVRPDLCILNALTQAIHLVELYTPSRFNIGKDETSSKSFGSWSIARAIDQRAIYHATTITILICGKDNKDEALAAVKQMQEEAESYPWLKIMYVPHMDYRAFTSSAFSLNDNHLIDTVLAYNDTFQEIMSKAYEDYKQELTNTLTTLKLVGMNKFGVWDIKERYKDEMSKYIHTSAFTLANKLGINVPLMKLTVGIDKVNRDIANNREIKKAIINTARTESTYKGIQKQTGASIYQIKELLNDCKRLTNAETKTSSIAAKISRKSTKVAH